MNGDLLRQYYLIQKESFDANVKTIVEAIEKLTALQSNYQLTDLQKSALRVLKSISVCELVADIQRDLAQGTVTLQTIEKRVALEEEIGQRFIELIQPNPVAKAFLELNLSLSMNNMRCDLKNRLLLVDSYLK